MTKWINKLIVWCDKTILRITEKSKTQIKQSKEEAVRCGPCYNCGEECIGTRRTDFRHSETGMIHCYGISKPETAVPVQVHRENLLMGFRYNKYDKDQT